MKKPTSADDAKKSAGPNTPSAQSSSATKYHDFLVVVGQYLRKARVDANLSANEVARKADCSASWLYSVETGEKNFTIISLLRVVEALGLDLRDVFVSGLDERHRQTAEKLQALQLNAHSKLVTLARIVGELRSISDESGALLEFDKAASDSLAARKQ